MQREEDGYSDYGQEQDYFMLEDELAEFFHYGTLSRVTPG